jgi:predicted  nucleic acid-binding Zn-ribbon protein
MAFEDIKAQISLLLGQVNNEPEDLHELQETFHQKLSEMRNQGLPIPSDLLELEKNLLKDFPQTKT